VDRAAKVHGDSNDHAKALKNIESSAHLKKYSAEELAATCRLLDPELLRLTGYRECLRRVKNDTYPSPDWEEFALGVPSDSIRSGAAGATITLEPSAETPAPASEAKGRLMETDLAKEKPREAPKPKEKPEETPKREETPKEEPKEKPKETPKQTQKDKPKEKPREKPKEKPKETPTVKQIETQEPKETAQEKATHGAKVPRRDSQRRSRSS
jgi:hypothetical protein